MSITCEERRDALFDLLASAPEGLTIDDIKDALACSRDQANRAIRHLRLFLSEDSINLPCEPRGPHEPWIYKLVGDLDGTRRWMANRLGDLDSRIRIMRAIAASIVNGTDGRKVEGRRSRLIERALRHLIENLDDLIESAP